jgi:alpha-tubulin suppressor-like RCC1 family protein
MRIQRGSRLAGGMVLAAGLAVSTVAGAGAARAQSAAGLLPARSAAMSWGSAVLGRLGDGQLDPDGNPASNRLRPGNVLGLTSGVVEVSAGYFNAMALTSDGRVWTWGSNLRGNLGNGTEGLGTGTAAPVAGLSGVTQVASGAWASYALRSDGTVWAWGNDEAAGGLTPAQVPGLTGVTQIAASQTGFALALRSDGTVWGWGSNNDGQLGTGASASGNSTPVQVKGLSGVTAIAAGQDMGLAISRRTVNGVPTTLTSVYAWGSQQFGQLGTGATVPQPVPQVVPGLPQVIGIAAGVNDSMAIGADGSVWAWGSDNVGQLGNSPRNAPVPSPIETFAPGSKIVQVSATSDHTLARRSDGTVLAFGSNGQGQLGIGTASPTSLPVQVSGLSGVTQVSAGRIYSLAVDRVLAFP